MNRLLQGRRLPGMIAAGACFLLTLTVAPAPLFADSPQANQAAAKPAGAPTADDARKFIDEVTKRLMALSIEASRAQWVQSTYITQDTEMLAAAAGAVSAASTTARISSITRCCTCVLRASAT